MSETTYSEARYAALVEEGRKKLREIEALHKRGPIPKSQELQLARDLDRIGAAMDAEERKGTGARAGRPATDTIEYRQALPDGADDQGRTMYSTEPQLLDLDARALKPGETMAARVRARSAEDLSNLFDFGDLIRAKCIGPRTAREKRAMEIGIDTAGGYLVPDFLMAQLIDLLRPVNTLFRAGCGMIDLPGFNVAYARVLGDSKAGPHGENQPITPSAPAFGRVLLVGHTIASLVAPVSEELIRSAPNLGEVVQRNIAIAMSQEIDRQGLFGIGAGDEMTGLANIAGTQIVDWGVGVNGGPIDAVYYDTISDARAALLGANAPEPRSVIQSVREDSVRAKLKDTLGRPLVPPPQIAGLNYFPTTKVPITEKYGTATNASRMILGDFSNCAIGFMVRMQIKTLQERYQDQLAYGFVAFTMLDFLVYQPSAFAQVKGIIPA